MTKVMTVPGSIAMTILSVALITSPVHARNARNEQNLIHVSGQGTVQFAPDVAQFQLGVSKWRVLVSDAVADHNDAANAVLVALKAAGEGLESSHDRVSELTWGNLVLDFGRLQGH